MGRVAVIGEPLRISGYGLAGAVLCAACSEEEAITAFRALPDDVVVAILTPSTERWLAGELARRPGLLPVQLPEPASQVAEPFPAVPGGGRPQQVQT